MTYKLTLNAAETVFQLIGTKQMLQRNLVGNYQSRINIPGKEYTLYNNYSETRNLIGKQQCRIRQSCTENLNGPFAL